MRSKIPIQYEKYRVLTGELASTASDGMNGAFLFRCQGVPLKVIVSDGTAWAESNLPGLPWEHVSVSAMCRCPEWEEMDWVKRIFWRDDETVMQLHVPRSNHVNCHQFCLHLWRPIGVDIALPPSICVGPMMEVKQ